MESRLWHGLFAALRGSLDRLYVSSVVRTWHIVFVGLVLGITGLVQEWAYVREEASVFPPVLESTLIFSSPECDRYSGHSLRETSGSALEDSRQGATLSLSVPRVHSSLKANNPLKMACLVVVVWVLFLLAVAVRLYGRPESVVRALPGPRGPVFYALPPPVSC